ncbi:MAG TPA: glycosyltransferase [Candidatus Cloacimonadota bacterium]|nr:glycosyltransferase [Candidatus Cloacimonadota bacterium]HPT72290.1 glycosyltransferase [Candidatus Cloacimonadota bacterium]
MDHNLQQLDVSIGVIVYNEAGNILNLLNALEEQNLSTVSIQEIIVVSSACTDGTDDLVREHMEDHPKVKLITEPERRGKSSAINMFLQNAVSSICIIESGDTIPARDTVEKMISPFANPVIGMTGARPMPVNHEDNFIGYAVHLLWRLHHRMATISPKLGEMVAFRKLFNEIPKDSAVDEASIEAMIRDRHKELKYIGDAMVYNKGPENLKDFIKQRRRIETGHLWLKRMQNYTVASQKSDILMQILKEEIREYPSSIVRIFAVMFLEQYCRLLGKYDFYVKKRNPFTWDIAESTKNLNKGA